MSQIYRKLSPKPLEALLIRPQRLYTSVDPAPATSGLLSGALKPEAVSDSNIKSLQSQLLDTQRPLFERYRAMFALRNIGTPSAVDALASGFTDESALFKCVPRMYIVLILTSSF